MYNQLRSYADIAGIGMFLLFINYFSQIKNKTNMENILYLLSIIGLICDTIFVFLKSKH